MKQLKKIGAILLCICFMLPFVSNNALAASASVRVSSTSGNVGSTVTVSCTAATSGSSIGSADVTLGFDATALQLVGCSSGANGSGGAVYYSGSAQAGGTDSLSFSVTFKILKEGTHSVSVSGEVYDWDTGGYIRTSCSGGSVKGKAASTGNSGSSGTGSSGTGSSGTGSSGTGSSGTGNSGAGSTTPDTQEPETNKDSNSKLSSLKVYPGSMTPAFNADTTSYTVSVSEDTKEVTISAAAQSEKASVSTSGGKDLKLGPNEAKAVVVAEDGTTTVYNITIMCGELEKITINEQEFLIDEAFTDDSIPTGFVREKVIYNEREYEALSHEKGNLKLMSLKNDEVGSEFYIYNQEAQTFYPFVMVQIAEGKFIIPLQIYETTEFSETLKLTVQDKEIDAWKIDDQFSVVHAMTMAGEEILYKYDQVDGTYQRYSEAVPEKAEVKEEKQPFWEQYSLYIIIGLSAVVVILAIVVIYFIATRNHKHNKRKRRMQKKLKKKTETE